MTHDTNDCFNETLFYQCRCSTKNWGTSTESCGRCLEGASGLQSDSRSMLAWQVHRFQEYVKIIDITVAFCFMQWFSPRMNLISPGFLPQESCYLYPGTENVIACKSLSSFRFYLQILGESNESVVNKYYYIFCSCVSYLDFFIEYFQFVIFFLSHFGMQKVEQRRLVKEFLLNVVYQLFQCFSVAINFKGESSGWRNCWRTTPPRNHYSHVSIPFSLREFRNFQQNCKTTHPDLLDQI